MPWQFANDTAVVNRKRWRCLPLCAVIDRNDGTYIFYGSRAQVRFQQIIAFLGIPVVSVAK